MKKLGIDFGDARIGLALSDALGILASPIEVYERKHYKKDVDFIGNIALQNGCDEIVIGKPYHLNGNEGDRIAKTEEFANSLKEKTKLKITYIDERLTTVQGYKLMKESKSKKNNIDSVCAAIILQTYLDRK